MEKENLVVGKEVFYYGNFTCNRFENSSYILVGIKVVKVCGEKTIRYDLVRKEYLEKYYDGEDIANYWYLKDIDRVFVESKEEWYNKYKEYLLREINSREIEINNLKEKINNI